VSNQARLRCPWCDTVTLETMPDDDRCIFFWKCPACGALVRPKRGECCVFCSYGDQRCGPSLRGESACNPDA